MKLQNCLRLVLSIALLVVGRSALSAPIVGSTQEQSTPEKQRIQEELRSFAKLAENPDTPSAILWKRWQEFRLRHFGSPECIQAAQLLRKAPSPLDHLERSQIPRMDRPPWLPAEVVAVLGEQRGRHWAAIHAIAISGDGRMVASTGVDDRVVLWDIPGLRERQVLDQGFGAQLLAVAFAPRDPILVTGRDKTIVLWDVGKAEAIERSLLRGHTATVIFLRFSANGRILASSSARETIVWDLNARTPRKLRIWKHEQCHNYDLSPDGRYLADTSGPVERTPDPRRPGGRRPGGGRAAISGSVRLWDLRATPEKAPLLLMEAQSPFAFSPDGNVLAGTTNGGQVRLWDLTKSKPKILTTLPGMGSRVPVLRFSPGGKILLRRDLRNTVEFWPLSAEGRKQLGLKREEQLARMQLSNGTYEVLWFPDGKSLLTGGRDGKLRVWDLATRAERIAAEGHTAPAHDLDFAPDCRSLVSGSSDSTIRLWDLTGRRARECVVLRGQTRFTYSLAFSPSGKKLLTSNGLDLKLWTVPLDTVAPLPVPDHQESIESLAWSSHGRLALSAGSDPRGLPRADEDYHTVPTVRIWELAGGRLAERDVIRFFYRTDITRIPPSIASSGTFSPDSKSVAFILGEDVRIWDVSGKRSRQQAVIKLDNTLTCLAFSPDGQTLAIGADEEVKETGHTPTYGRVRLWRMGKSKPLPRMVLSGHGYGSIRSITFSPDGKLLASAGQDHKIIVWDSTSGKKVHEWKLPGVVYKVAFAPDSRHLATANGNGTIYIFRLAPGPKPKPAKS